MEDNSNDLYMVKQVIYTKQVVLRPWVRVLTVKKLRKRIFPIATKRNIEGYSLLSPKYHLLSLLFVIIV